MIIVCTHARARVLILSGHNGRLQSKMDCQPTYMNGFLPMADYFHPWANIVIELILKMSLRSDKSRTFHFGCGQTPNHVLYHVLICLSLVQVCIRSWS